MIRRSRGAWPWAVCVMAGFLACLVLSKNSPLYPLNDWPDIHCFMTVGRQVRHGAVLYRDIYEQKGPILYFIFAVLSLFGEYSFLPVFVLESLAQGLFAAGVYHICRLYCDDGPFALLSGAVSPVLVCCGCALAGGGSLEELALPVLIWPAYLLMRDIGNGSVTGRTAAISGAACGWLFWQKYTICAFFLGMICVVICVDVLRGQAGHILRQAGLFLAGFVAVSVPVLLYFAAHGALGDLWTAYFYNNIFVYPVCRHITEGNTYLTENFSHGLGRVFILFSSYLVYTMPWGIFVIIAACVYLADGWSKRDDMAWMSLLFFIYLTAMGFLPFKPQYYWMPFAVFLPMAYVALYRRVRSGRALRTCACAGLAAVMLAGLLSGGENAYLRGIPLEDTVQGRFGRIIRESEDRTLLVYGGLDYGLFFTGRAQPAGKYFCWLLVEPDDMLEEHRRIIENREAEFVALDDPADFEDSGIDWSGYELVDTCPWYYSKESVREYSLYRRCSR